jgi:hypothetical protein
MMNPTFLHEDAVCTCAFSHQRELERDCVTCGGYIVDDVTPTDDNAPATTYTATVLA